MRYWHGSMIVVRPLLVFFNLHKIYQIMAIVCGILCICILLQLVHKKYYGLGIAWVIGWIMTASWNVPWCLEYVWTYLIMMVVTMITIHKADKEMSQRKWNLLFLVTGMLTCFFDFLTTEIITLFVPVIVLIGIRYYQKKWTKNSWKQLLQWIIFWGIGYVAMWLTKWVLASLILQVNAWDYVKEKMFFRMNPMSKKRFDISMFLGVWERNFNVLIPFCWIQDSYIKGAIVVAMLATAIILCKKDRKHIGILCLFFGIALIPYIRYAVLPQHSFSHFIFTYRSQIITIMAYVMGICCSMDRESLTKPIRKKR